MAIASEGVPRLRLGVVVGDIVAGELAGQLADGVGSHPVGHHEQVARSAASSRFSRHGRSCGYPDYLSRRMPVSVAAASTMISSQFTTRPCDSCVAGINATGARSGDPPRHRPADRPELDPVRDFSRSEPGLAGSSRSRSNPTPISLLPVRRTTMTTIRDHCMASARHAKQKTWALGKIEGRKNPRFAAFDRGVPLSNLADLGIVPIERSIWSAGACSRFER